VALLENISEKIINKTTDGEKVGGNKGDIDFKKDLIKKSALTLEEAKAQYETLKVKMERIDSLQPTLKKEIQNYREKLDKFHKEINEKYDQIESQKEFLKSEVKRMTQLSIFLEKNKDNYNKLSTSLLLNSRSKAANLEEIETFKKLREMEKKIQENENYIFSLQSYIDSRANENEFSAMLKECMDLQAQINSELIKRIH